ncbi:integrase domain-containing protein [Paraglaciecola sp. MB-3u-78]|uniref:integrase domain-containing protein n=1 Tax=Paraglaciecola sp. MB-3u-78 TaxID=2058332 RepID=UPI000C33EF8B|nr:integrase domain-containing protein [Paraglaciecola sp. MB-3u-78]PKG97572.1 integrase [Paraglaciecola sp. MB-3u-78]
MPRVAKPLSDSQIARAKPKDKNYTLTDGQGLSLRVRFGGTKDWIFRYKLPFTIKRVDMSFGIYPKVSLADARTLRTKAHELLAKDIDPRAFKEQTKRAALNSYSNSFAKVMQEWIVVKSTKVSQDHANKIQGSLEKHVLPAIGNRPISELMAAEVIEVLKPVQAKGHSEQVKRLCQRINEVMDFAVNTGVIHINPLSKMNAAFLTPTKKHLPTLKPSDLPRLMQTLNIASIKIVTRCLIEWQLHTMVRPNEAATTRWVDIDFEKQVWTIPAVNMKKKGNGDHVVPLTQQSIQLLEFIKPISGHREYVFPADRNPRSHANSSTANMALKRMGFDKELVAHGMRALASTTLNEQAFDPDVIESALAHVDKNEVRRAYNRAEYIERRRKLMQWWSEHIEQAANGNMSLANATKTLRLVNQ